jgi:hypothetical protein
VILDDLDIAAIQKKRFDATGRRYSPRRRPWWWSIQAAQARELLNQREAIDAQLDLVPVDGAGRGDGGPRLVAVCSSSRSGPRRS